jgi:hypothetical protein
MRRLVECWAAACGRVFPNPAAPLATRGHAMAEVSIPPMGVTRRAPLARGDGVEPLGGAAYRNRTDDLRITSRKQDVHRWPCLRWRCSPTCRSGRV